MSNNDFMLAEFKGTYRAPHPDGIKDQNIIKNFHVQVEMKKSFLKAPGLKGTFAVYYKELCKSMYPDMIDLYKFDLVEATELDGSPINNPKAMSYQDLVKYINEKQYPINIALYSQSELRNQVVLHEEDPKGQQKLQGITERTKGNAIAETNAIMSRIKPIRRLDKVENKEKKAALAGA